MPKDYIVGVDKGHPEGDRMMYTAGIVMRKKFIVVAEGLNFPDTDTMKRIRRLLINEEEQCQKK